MPIEEEEEKEKCSVELTILRAVGLLGDSIFDKLDSFVIVKPGTGTDISRDDASGRGDSVGFRTPTQFDKGPNPEINASGKLEYSDEEGLEFYVYSEDKRSNELIGVAFLPKAEFLTESFSGKLALAGAFSGKGASKKAGHLVVDVNHVRWLFRVVESRGQRKKCPAAPPGISILYGWRRWSREEEEVSGPSLYFVWLMMAPPARRREAGRSAAVPPLPRILYG